jgi:hypothetical protein
VGWGALKIRTVAMLMVVCVLSGIVAGFLLKRPKPDEPTTIVEYVVDNSPAIWRLRISEALITNLERRKRLIVLEANLEEDVTIDDGFAGWDIFQKAQTITVKATGRFTVDLGALTSDDIIFDDFSKRVAIRLLRPEIDSVTINEEQTVFHSVEKGLLRFGEIRLTTAEQNEIYRQAKAAMISKLKSDMEKEAEEAAKAAVGDLAGKILGAAGIYGYEIVVVWG